MNKITNKLKQDYENICNDIIRKFEKKHGIEFSYWVADRIGMTACFIDQYFFSFDDITFDIFSCKPKGLIIEWMDYLSDNFNREYMINFQSYCMGARY